MNNNVTLRLQAQDPEDPVKDPTKPDIPEPTVPGPTIPEPSPDEPSTYPVIDPVPEPEPFPRPPEPIPAYPPDVVF